MLNPNSVDIFLSMRLALRLSKPTITPTLFLEQSTKNGRIVLKRLRFSLDDTDMTLVELKHLI
jgi:hypothetical protein